MSRMAVSDSRKLLEGESANTAIPLESRNTLKIDARGETYV